MLTLPLALLCLGIALIALRCSVGARHGRALLLDATIPFGGFALFLAATGRPFLSLLPVLAAMAGLVLVDRTKRDVLREPVVFADRAELIEVVRHPRLYLPFAGTGLVLGGAAAAVALVAGFAWAEPPVFAARPLLWPLWIGLAVLGFVLPARKPLLPLLAALYTRLGVTRDPIADLARFGMFACFIMHATLARAERPARRQLAAPSVLHALDGAPVVIVQSESWFDVGRLHPDLRGALPAIETLRQQSALHGHLAVPAWGANTVRSEFAVLTGIDEAALGLDRFNPYAAFARTDLPSIAWHARQHGYRTICVHPFDLGFYGRSHVLPHLGFDRLVGPEAFAAAPRGGEWVCDLALGREVSRLLREDRGKTLIFAISMECHGPYDRASGTETPLPPALAAALAGIPEAEQLARYLARLRGTDAMVADIAATLRQRDAGWLAFYGDHQPSLPHVFAALGLHDPRADYRVWNAADPADAPTKPQDCDATLLGAALTGLMARQTQSGMPVFA